MLNKARIQGLCRAALTEDIGSGDATTTAIVPADLQISASLVTRRECVCAGLLLVETVFKELDEAVAIDRVVEDGDRCAPGCTLATLEGQARAILTGERTALNFIQRLSGIATLTRAYVDAVGDRPVKILDTRKTTPGWRALEKYAVTCGGGENHRFGLYDRVMVKDNHRFVAGLKGPDSIQRAVDACRQCYPSLEVEVEADTLDDVRDAAAAGADYILLDNMTDEHMREAVQIAAGKSRLEASGGITLERIPAIAKTGVNFISVGALTHSAPAVAIGLDAHLGA